MRLYLDTTGMTEAEREDRPYVDILPDRIPLRLGRHQLQFDVIEQEIPGDVLGEARELCLQRMISQGARPTLNDPRPIGINIPRDCGARVILVDAEMEVEIREIKTNIIRI